MEGNLLSHGFDLPPLDLTTLSPSSSSAFPQPSAVPHELPPTTWKSHTTYGSYATRLLTDGLPLHAADLPKACQIWKNSTPASNLVERFKKVTKAFISYKNQGRTERYNFIPLILRVKPDKALREAALSQRETQIEAWER